MRTLVGVVPNNDSMPSYIYPSFPSSFGFSPSSISSSSKSRSSASSSSHTSAPVDPHLTTLMGSPFFLFRSFFQPLRLLSNSHSRLPHRHRVSISGASSRRGFQSIPSAHISGLVETWSLSHFSSYLPNFHARTRNLFPSLFVSIFIRF